MCKIKGQTKGYSSRYVFLSKYKSDINKLGPWIMHDWVLISLKFNDKAKAENGGCIRLEACCWIINKGYNR